MEILEVLCNYEPGLGNPDIYQEIMHSLADVTTAYRYGNFDNAVYVLDTLVTDINDCVGYELIVDSTVTYDECAIQLYDGHILSLV